MTNTATRLTASAIAFGLTAMLWLVTLPIGTASNVTIISFI